MSPGNRLHVVVLLSFVLSLAVTRMKLTPAEALSAATVNAACSLGRGSEIGSLEPGKLADFTIFEVRDWREVAYWIGIPLARCVYVGARLVFQTGTSVRDQLADSTRAR